jgi:hypothetical protein
MGAFMKATLSEEVLKLHRHLFGCFAGAPDVDSR